jgi:pimeloyl-ACP methyl ester carboxylesterase
MRRNFNSYFDIMDYTQGPLLIFHPPGWGIGAVPYQATLSRLEELFTVVYLPRGAAGVAGPPKSAALDVGAFVSDLEQLRRQLGVEEFGLAGHSHSSLTTLHYTLRHARTSNRSADSVLSSRFGPTPKQRISSGAYSYKMRKAGWQRPWLSVRAAIWRRE